MQSFGLSNYALGVVFAIALLAGCGGSQALIGAPAAVPQQSVRQSLPFQAMRDHAIAAQDDKEPSWMAPDAKSKDLLYVSNTNTVTIYSYPHGKLEGRIRFGFVPVGECVDKKGDVFITNLDTEQILEYAHGGTKPIATLESPTADPYGCAIDPTTGNLAVSSLGFGTNGSVGIYKNARGTPTIYRDRSFQEYEFCGYDASGNLFVDGDNKDAAFEFAELPKGGGALKSVTLNQNIGWPGGVQWDGKYVTVGDQTAPVIYQFVIQGTSGTKVGSTSLGGSDVGAVAQFLILGHRLIVPNGCTGSCTGNVLYYDYPAGGEATKTITNGVRYPHGLVVSKAQN
jgi:hypothetical protein